MKPVVIGNDGSKKCQPDQQDHDCQSHKSRVSHAHALGCMIELLLIDLKHSVKSSIQQMLRWLAK